MGAEGQPHNAPAVVKVDIGTLTAARVLTDPELHPERRGEAERVSANLDHLIEVAEQATWPL